MATAQLVSVEEYLRTSYTPDAEYVEGVVIPRAMPQKPHSKMQAFLIRGLCELGNPMGFEVWLEQRVQIQAPPRLHCRIPDVCLTAGEPEEDTFTSPPYLCVEILSPEDNALELRRKVQEYLAFGVPFVWVIDPESRQGEVYTSSGIQSVIDGVFHAGEISIDIRDL
ncbi:MAG: hypothetical protein JWO80_4794 [Bryobacterales bacterium]|nr:hypothetical protein [Bryobacterales bacterium]